MTTAAAMARAARVNPADLRCAVNVERMLVGARDERDDLVPGLSHALAKATMEVFGDDDDDPEVVTLATAEAYAVDVRRFKTVKAVLGALDRIGDEVFGAAEAALTADVPRLKNGSGPLRLTLEPAYQLVIVTNVEVEEPYRGQRIGPRLLTTLIDTLDGAGGVTIAVLRAEPLQWPDLGEAELRAAQKKVGASYESVGFQHLTENLYWRHTAYRGTENLQQ